VQHHGAADPAKRMNFLVGNSTLTPELQAQQPSLKHTRFRLYLLSVVASASILSGAMPGAAISLPTGGGDVHVITKF